MAEWFETLDAEHQEFVTSKGWNKPASEVVTGIAQAYREAQSELEARVRTLCAAGRSGLPADMEWLRETLAKLEAKIWTKPRRRHWRPGERKRPVRMVLPRLMAVPRTAAS